MKPLTLALAVTLIMAVVGDSDNMKRLLQQLRLLAGEKTIQDNAWSHTNKLQAEGEGTQYTPKLASRVGGVKALTLTPEKSEPRGSQREMKGGIVDGPKEAKKAVPAFLASAAKEIGGKVVGKLGDRIADGVVENYQDKVVSGLQNYLGKQMDKFDDEYKDLLQQTNGLAAGLSRPVEEADVQLVPRPGATMGNMYAPPGWEIRHKYKYKDGSDEDKGSSGGQAAAFTYPAGLGPVLMNGCFGTGYKNGDPCFQAKIPKSGCPNLIDGATYLGVGFDGRGVYSAESRKKSVIQRSCSNLQTYGDHEVPDSMTVQGIYDTNVESFTFSSTEEYRQYLEEKSAITSAKAMFQEEINKASGHGAWSGAFGIGWSAGGGGASQRGTSSQSSTANAASSAGAQLTEQQTQLFMAMLEMNIFRYEIFMDDVTPDQLNVGFLRDFTLLPESYFSPGAEIIFQNFYLRWGTHYIKSAKFGGQLKIIKTKEATKDLTMSEFANAAESDWKMTMSTFSAQASQTKSGSWWHQHETKEESQQSAGTAESGSTSQTNRNQEKQASSQQYSNEVLSVQGGDQQIAAAITEMYTTALTTELKDWLESIKDYPKPFSFVLRPVSDLLNIPFDSLFPKGDRVDFGCLGKTDLSIEEDTGRKYYTLTTTKHVDGNTTNTDESDNVTASEIRYCNFANRKHLEDSMTKRRLALARAVTVYLEEGRLLSSDFLLPAGEAGCETAMLAYLQGNKNGVPTWDEMIGGKEFTVIFDMPYAIPGILHAQDVLELKFVSHMWFSLRRGDVPHLYDGYKNGGSGEIQAKKVSVQGLVMTYDDNMGVFTVTNENFEASLPFVPDLPEWIKGRNVARAEYKKLLDHLSKKPSTTGDVPCNVHWSNAHRFDPTNGGKCIHFTAASEGDLFVVFASIPQNHETWIYIQISTEGVALYKGMRLQTTQLNYNAGGLGSTTLYQSYFVCVTEDVEKTTTAIQYGKTPDNEERPHVWLSFSFKELASLRYYSFGSGEYPVKVMGLSLLDKQPKDFIICREGTELINGMCQQKCHSECEGCRTSGSNSSVDCIACKHLKVSYPYREGETGNFECVPQCPQHMEAVSTQTCTCIKKMEEVHPNGVVDCVTECPLTHFDNNNECRKCSSFCKDVSDVGARVCSGPSSSDCDTCKYQHEGRCLQGCSPGQKAVGESGTFICRQCQAGHECKLGDEREDICAAGTASNDNRTACEPCAAGLFSGSAGAASCRQCPPGTYSTGGGSTRCSTCPAETYSNAGASTCDGCHAGYRVHLANCYKAFHDRKSYVDAASVCRADGGRLATPRDKITNQFLITLKNKLDDSSWFWLGMDDRGREGSWRYIDGTRLGEFQPWAPGEPNQLGGNEDCGMFFQNPRNDWNDQDCSSKLYFICQMPFKTNEDVTSLGCWKDTPNRAIPMLEGTDPQLDGVYLERSDALRKCYQVARSRGLVVFSVQNGGQCFGSANDSTYNKYGPSTACKMDGEGGPWANEVYQIITG